MHSPWSKKSIFIILNTQRTYFKSNTGEKGKKNLLLPNLSFGIVKRNNNKHDCNYVLRKAITLLVPTDIGLLNVCQYRNECHLSKRT